MEKKTTPKKVNNFLEYVGFNGKQYPYMLMSHKRQTYRIGCESLSDVLINHETGLPINDEARSIDEDIYFYIPDEILKYDSLIGIKAYVLQHCS